MEFGEFKLIVKGLKAVYSKDNFLASDEAIKIWYTMLKDIPYERLNIATQKYILTNKFPPSIAELREMAVNVEQGDEITWDESFDEARRMIRKYGYPRQKEALEEMRPITRQVVERMGYMDMCMCEDIEVERGQYRMAFENQAKRNKEYNQLPERLKEQIAEAQRRLLNG